MRKSVIESRIKLHILVKGTVIADLTGWSVHRVDALAKDGVLPREPSGLYYLDDTIKAAMSHTRGNLRGTGVVSEKYSLQRTRLTSMKADMAELQHQKLVGELLPREDVKNGWIGIISIAKQRFLALPSRLAPRIIRVKTAVDAMEMLKAEIMSILQGLSEDRFAPVTSNASGKPRGRPRKRGDVGTAT